MAVLEVEISLLPSTVPQVPNTNSPNETRTLHGSTQRAARMMEASHGRASGEHLASSEPVMNVVNKK